MKKALLIIGDKNINRQRPHLSFRRFTRYARGLKNKQGLEVQIIDYQKLLSAKTPLIEAPEISVILFFPYKYWNKNIEVYDDDRIYGDKTFGREFKLFFSKVEQAIGSHYGRKQIKYVNPPRACYLDRDKLASKRLLRRNNIPVPRTFLFTPFTNLQKLLERGTALYIKPRFGAMGKGITYVDRAGAFSNFIYHDGRIKSRPSDFDWKFVRIKDKEEFINTLLKKGFICEEAIKPATFKKRRFDFRVYVINGRVVYLYAKSSPVNFWVTNWSQGGHLDKKKIILRTIARKKIAIAKNLAKRAAQVLGLNFAGIDIIFSDDFKKAYVLEGNAFPGNEKGYDLMKCLLDYVIK